MEHEHDKITADGALSFLLHQDNLMWSRLQTMQAVQLAGLAGAYTVRSTVPAAIAILVVSALLTLLMFGLRRRDELILAEFQRSTLSMTWRAPRKWYAPLTGRETTWALLAILLTVDVFAGYTIMRGIT